MVWSTTSLPAQQTNSLRSLVVSCLDHPILFFLRICMYVVHTLIYKISKNVLNLFLFAVFWVGILFELSVSKYVIFPLSYVVLILTDIQFCTILLNFGALCSLESRFCQQQHQPPILFTAVKKTQKQPILCTTPVFYMYCICKAQQNILNQKEAGNIKIY